MIPIAEPVLLGREADYVREVVESRQFSYGPFVARFENEIATRTQSGHAVACTSGSTALHLALLALGVGPGTQVIVPATTYIATANAVRYCGGTPVVADVDPRTWCLDPREIDRLVEAGDGAVVGVIPVHLYGVLADMPAIRVRARRYGLWIVEDAAEAHGATGLGQYSEAVVYSFYGNKIITCGEGGAVATSDRYLAAAMRLYRGQGQGATRYQHDVLGYNYRMTELQAALGVGQIEVLDEHLLRRSQLGDRYRRHLGVHQARRLVGDVDWVYPLLTDRRDAVEAACTAAGIETRRVFPGLHTQPIYRTRDTRPLPHAERLAAYGLLLPLHLNVSPADVDAICAVVKEAQAHATAA